MLRLRRAHALWLIPITVAACSPAPSAPRPAGPDAASVAPGDDSTSDSTSAPDEGSDGAAADVSSSPDGGSPDTDLDGSDAGGTGPGRTDSDGGDAGGADPMEDMGARSLTMMGYVTPRCDGRSVSGFGLALATDPSSCNDVSSLDEYLQLTVSDNDTLPPSAGRTYTVVAMLDPQQFYPDDGDATAVWWGRDVRPAISGTLTIEPGTTEAYVGTIDLELRDRTSLAVTFSAEECRSMCD